MKVTLVKRKSKDITAFSLKEWKEVDIAKYNHPTDWTRKVLYIIAKENKDIVGLCEFHLMGGISEVIALIVRQDQRGKGLGSQLLEKMEEEAKNENAHKVYLTTGKTWKANDFYKNHGYKKNWRTFKSLAAWRFR